MLACSWLWLDGHVHWEEEEEGGQGDASLRVTLVSEEHSPP